MGRKGTVSILDEDGLFCPEVLQWADQNPGTVILESNPGDAANRMNYLFLRPLEIIRAETLDGVEGALQKIDAAVAEGCFAAGCVSYEAGYAFEPRLSGKIPEISPLLWFGLFERPIIVDRRMGAVDGPSDALRQLRESVRALRQATLPAAQPLHFRPSVSEARYLDAFARIQEYIEAGDTYQVNLTFRLFAPCTASASGLYARMRKAQRVSYGAFINTGPLSLLSCSPELFFRRSGNRVTLKPMKGTIARGRTLAEDQERAKVLTESEKNRAENLMIVDLLRNDIGKIARPGSVRVKRFFEIERYETVFQATSTIEALLKAGVTIPEFFQSLFPSGSVTGAPKIRTMEIISELESTPRGFYTGSIGFFAPRKTAVFNVAIRTLVVDKEAQSAEFGVGSGVVHDSQGTDEYRECLLKAQFLQTEPGDFGLIETTRWDHRHGWFLLARHLRRLKDSAAYFGFRYSPPELKKMLREAERKLRQHSRKDIFKVRLLLNRHGRVSIEHSRLDPIKGRPFVRFSPVATDAWNRFLFHKTTNRELYNRELSAAKEEGFFDVLFRNKQGEMTEGARSNIFIRRGDTFLTPPLECGLLPGIYRSYFLASRRKSIREERLYPDDLMSADDVFVCNALRGLVKVSFPEHAMTA
jgi:para-aminobenzoate synthetase/4-amino-4-deoxychorismate lyase